MTTPVCVCGIRPLKYFYELVKQASTLHVFVQSCDYQLKPTAETESMEE